MCLPWEERWKLRSGDGSTREEEIDDWNLLGLDALLEKLPLLSGDQQSERAELLWNSLIELVHKGRQECFRGTYRYHYHTWRSRSFPSRFVKRLNEATWIPNADSSLRSPNSVEFADLGWEADEYLLSLIEFMQPHSPAVASLAKEVGVEPETLDLIREHKITPAMLRELLASNGSAPTDDSSSEHDSAESDKPEDSFARHFHGVQSTTPSYVPDNPITMPTGGSHTSQSARDHTVRSKDLGRSEPHRLRLVERAELGPEGQALEDEFRSMVEGDYGKRCQICTRTFSKTGGGWQVNVVHVVPPRMDYRTNHFGDLLGLCGWHFNLLLYGEWALLDPNTDRPFEDMDGTHGWERMRTFILNRTPDTDEFGNQFVGFPVRFSNVFQGWQTEPSPITEEIRYTIPHWKYLCELLRA